jgi:predicted transcriptional regulator
MLKMGLTKYDLHDENINALTALIKSISQPARLRIVHYIKTHGACNNKALVTELGLTQSTVSEHLEALKAVNIIQATKFGNGVMYSLHSELMREFGVAMQIFFT